MFWKVLMVADVLLFIYIVVLGVDMAMHGYWAPAVTMWVIAVAMAIAAKKIIFVKHS